LQFFQMKNADFLLLLVRDPSAASPSHNDYGRDRVTKVKTGSNDRPDLPLAVVVGAGGMGMAVARRLGQRYRILLTDINVARLESNTKSLCSEGHDAIAVACDITDVNSVSNLASAVSAAGPLRVLAHVAGLSPSMADWQTIMRVNLLGARLVEQALLPLAGSGTAAIFISSLAGHLPPPASEILTLLDKPLDPDFLDQLEAALGEVTTTLSYQLSKVALIRLCEQRAFVWGKVGARILSLSPGLIATPMGALEFERQPIKFDLLAKTPLQREGTMLEIADAVEYLASDRASFISGTDILVDGGIAAALKHG
jgi:NAD(P)-dependent dehydrogenase (short-subunit alcohol dehydrogenase family)